VELKKSFDQFVKQMKKDAEDYKKHLGEAKQKREKPRSPRIPSIQIEYIYKGKAQMKEYRLR
jgi:hypothetical protein